MTRFEHATSCSQSRRSTKLSYIWIMVRMEGVEPSRYYYPGILSPMRLPIPPHSHNCGVLLLSFYDDQSPQPLGKIPTMPKIGVLA